MGRILICFLISIFAMSFSPWQSAEVSQAYQIKAVFLFNFAQFVEWPQEAFPDTKAPLVIGVLGENPFGSLLEETVSGEESNGHPMTVAYYSGIEEVKACHILFVNPEHQKNIANIVSALKGSRILTVGDKENFTKEGGMVRLAMESNKIRLKINLNAVKSENLAISSKLLRLADIVDTRNINP